MYQGRKPGFYWPGEISIPSQWNGEVTNQIHRVPGRPRYIVLFMRDFDPETWILNPDFTSSIRVKKQGFSNEERIKCFNTQIYGKQKG